jgi:hypothetical protein
MGFDVSSQKLYIETITNDFYSTIRLYDVSSFAASGKCKAYILGSTALQKHIFRNNYHFVTDGSVEKLP